MILGLTCRSVDIEVPILKQLFISKLWIVWCYAEILRPTKLFNLLSFCLILLYLGWFWWWYSNNVYVFLYHQQFFHNIMKNSFEDVTFQTNELALDVKQQTKAERWT